MLIFSRVILQDLLNEISRSCDEWLNQYAYGAPHDVFNRRKYMRGLKCFIQTMVGSFVKPNFNKKQELYIFEGLRYKDYMKAFKPDSVVIIGSHMEKKYANTCGYGFCWSFAMESAVRSKIGRGWNYPGIRQITFWLDRLSISSKATFFLYEDTQPLGVFIVHLSKLLYPKVSTVCIQHGYLVKSDVEIRAHGNLSDINFVWDKSQAELIGCNRAKTFEIGLPYIARAKQTKELRVILVGPGTAPDGTDFFQRCIKTYDLIRKMLINVSGLEVLYRPHPNEYTNKKLLAELSNTFSLVDNPDKLKQLDGPRAIFIGTVSSLLYEAGIAGHFVAHLKIHSDMKLAFHYDQEFEENEINKLILWILSIKNKKITEKKNKLTSHLTPLDRFNEALRAAKLIG